MNVMLLPYRGVIQAISVLDEQLLFVTKHPEQQATALYSITVDDKEHPYLSQLALPCGALHLLAIESNIWMAGQDGKLYHTTGINAKAKALRGIDFSGDAAFNIQSMADEQLVLLQKRQLSLVSHKGTINQTLPLPNNASTMATNPSGEWIAVGFENGDIAVYQYQDKQLTLSSQAPIHQGRVSAIQFERNELRFYSAGTDKKLFQTHAQGELQALDKGKSSNHQSTINSIVMGETCFFTGASDKSIKAWAYSGGKPTTISKGLGQVRHMAILPINGKNYLLTADSDKNNSLRAMPLSSADVPNEVKFAFQDAYALATEQLKKSRAEPKLADAALELLASYDDQQSFSLLEKQLNNDSHKSLKQKVIDIASASQHPLSTPLLETALRDEQHDVVRLAAFDALVRQMPKNSIRPYQLAIDSGYINIGSQALQALTPLAKKETQAEQAMIQALQHNKRSLRLLSLSLLETVYPKTSPKASLYALQHPEPELQRAALIRLFQRKLLDQAEVRRVVLSAQDSHDAMVRHTALLIAILSQAALTKALKSRDSELARQLQELEAFDLLKPDSKAQTSSDAVPQSSFEALTHIVKKVTKKKQSTELSHNELSDADYTPLLQGMVNQHNDICFTAGFALAVLRDQRAFALLLMLAQDNDVAVRVGVCRAFAILKQTDAIQQLVFLLDDDDVSVRDAAFIALSELQNTPYQLVSTGFNAQHENIHQHALKSLLDTQGKKKSLSKEALTLLKQALNDPFEKVRQEAFKACLNRQLGGDLASTLTLLFSSHHENVHSEVFNELLANNREDWAKPLLLEQFNNPYQQIREKAFNTAIKEKKKFTRHNVLERAIQSTFEDLRHAALRQIKNQPSKRDWELLQILLDDDADSLRIAAMSVVSKANDKSTLLKALNSKHDDIALHAATLCAKLGFSECYDVLSGFAQREKPDTTPEEPLWHKQVGLALTGLQFLEDNRACDIVLKHACSNDDALADLASQVIPRVCDQTQADKLADLLNHERAKLKANAAFSLVLLGDERGAALLRDKEIKQHLDTHAPISATLAQAPVTVVSLRPHLVNSKTRNSATLSLLCHEFLLHGDNPKLTVNALSVESPFLRRIAADVIANYANENQRWALLQTWFSQQLQQSDKIHWQESITTLQQVAAILVHGSNFIKYQLIQVLQTLDKQVKREQWEQEYTAFSTRYADAIEAASAQVKNKPVNTEHQSQWMQTAFGAYLGLLRLDRNEPAAVNIRLQAMKGLCQLSTQNDNALKQATISCLLTQLNNSHTSIRQSAYQNLQDLDMPLETLGQAAIASRHEDVAKAGLQLLVSHYPHKLSRQLLEDIVITGKPVLANSAYTLLEQDERVGLFALSPHALASFTVRIRQRCVYELAVKYTEKEAQKWLLEASSNENRHIQHLSLLKLAENNHPKTLSLIEHAWHSSESAEQQIELLICLKVLNQPGVAQFLVNSLNQKDTLKAETQSIYKQIAECRDTSVFERMIEQLKKNDSDCRLITDTLNCITGYDQTIHDDDDADDELEAPVFNKNQWIEKQHPRHDDLHVSLFQTLIDIDQHKLALQLLRGIGWMPENQQADFALTKASAVADSQLLLPIIKTISQRARFRKGPIEALLAQLAHKDPHIQFTAAEGIARSGHTQGNSVLLSACDYLESIDDRQRAVIALGESGDANVFERLLSLAENNEHALQETATEAIGHLGHSEAATALISGLASDLKPTDYASNKVLTLLKGALQHGEYFSEMPKRALNGLRWLNSAAAWDEIIHFIEIDEHDEVEHAIKLLRYRDTPGTRDFLLALLKNRHEDSLLEAAHESATQLFKPKKDTLSPIDLAVVQGYAGYTLIGNESESSLDRVCRYANTEELLFLLNEDLRSPYKALIYPQLQQALMQRDTPSASELATGLCSERTEMVGVIAKIMALSPSITKSLETELQKALQKHDDVWFTLFQKLEKIHDSHAEKTHHNTCSENQEKTVINLLNAAIVHNVESPVLIKYLEGSEPHQQSAQASMLSTLLATKNISNKALETSVAGLQNSPMPHIRQRSQQWLYQQTGNNKSLHWECFTHQPDVINSKHFSASIAEAARSGKQARALPVLIQQQDSDALNSIANDASLEENLRIGAIEGLGLVHSNPAEQHLKVLCAQEDLDPDIGRAAFRALRRSQRARLKLKCANTQRGTAA